MLCSLSLSLSLYLSISISISISLYLSLILFLYKNTQNLTHTHTHSTYFIQYIIFFVLFHTNKNFQLHFSVNFTQLNFFQITFNVIRRLKVEIVIGCPRNFIRCQVESRNKYTCLIKTTLTEPPHIAFQFDYYNRS
jgi:hypothetical protein